MKRMIVVAVAVLLLPAGVAAQTPAAELATPPDQARTFTVLSMAGRHGTVATWTAPDGTLMGRLSVLLRGQVWEQDEATRLASDGTIARFQLRGTSPGGDVGETFEIAGGRASWTSPYDSGTAAYLSGAFYLPTGWSPRAGDLPIEWLVAHPGRSLALLPGGRARVEKLTSMTVGAGAGPRGARQVVTAWAVFGIQGTPVPVWTDDKGKVFAWIGGLSTIRTGYEDALPALEKAQDAALAVYSPRLARSLATPLVGPLAFVDVRAFVDGSRFAEHQTVIVSRGRIVAAGPVADIRVPAGARIVRGAGRTLVPGLWDGHLHVTDDFTGPYELSLGVTSVRDPGNPVTLTQARRDRRAKGRLLMPHVHASTMIDGQGPNAAQFAHVVGSLAEALEAVRKAKADGQIGVKFYGSLDPAWIAPAAAEAHRLGLHVHGHLPAKMRTKEAIDAGYDEITHINFVAMQAMPDEVVDRSNGMQRFQGIGRLAKDIDLDAEPMRSLITTMAQRRIVVDPTLAIFEGTLAAENGDLSPTYAPYAGTLPAAVERGIRSGGMQPEGGATRADFRASFQKLKALVGRLHQAGVPIVAGTDGSGLELVRELELYVEAGFTPEAALAAATSVPARVFGVDGRTGRIAVGLDADLVLVEGDPSRRIGDLRQVRLVLMDGLLMDADRLRAAVGFSRRPAQAELSASRATDAGHWQARAR